MRSSFAEQRAADGITLLFVVALGLPLLGLLMPLLSLPSAIAGADFPFPFGPRPMGLLGRSILFSAVVAAASSGVGAALALALTRSRSGRILLALLLPPLLVTPPAIHGINWTLALLAIGSHSTPGLAKALSSGWLGAGIAETLSFLPVALGTAWAGLWMLDDDLAEAGLVYASEATVRRRISLRLALPVLLSGAAVVFLLSLSEYAVPSLFSVNVFALEIFSTYSVGLHPAATVWTAAPMMLAVVLTLLAIRPLARRAEALARGRRAHSASSRLSRDGGAPGVAAAFLLASFLLPLIVTARAAGSWSALAVAASGAREELAVSVGVALSTAALCIVLGASGGRALAGHGPGAALAWLLTGLTFALPAPLAGIGILQFGLSSPWLEEILPVWAGVARFLPMAALVSFALRRRAERGLIEAGRLYARSRGHALRRITVPLLLPGLVILGATCFAFSMGELGATLLVASPGRATLMMRLFNLLHYGASREAAALSLLLTLPALGAGVLLTRVLRSRSTHLFAVSHDA